MIGAELEGQGFINDQYKMEAAQIEECRLARSMRREPELLDESVKAIYDDWRKGIYQPVEKSDGQSQTDQETD